MTFDIFHDKIKMIMKSSEVCMRECQFCKELIKENASVCKYCKRKQRTIIPFVVDYVGCGWLALGIGLILFILIGFISANS